ncbi:DUF1856 [Mactra antiquata]
MDYSNTSHSSYNISLNDNGTISENKCGEVHDIKTDLTARLAILYLTITLGLLGGILVLLWMAYNRKVSPRFNHLSRVNSFILNLTFADIFVILWAVLPQLLWEYADREWQSGPVMCKLLKFVQGFTMMSSNYILVVIAIDRHQAIRAPLKESWPVWKMAGLGWLIAGICALPMVGIFRTNVVNGKPVCENIFRGKPEFHRQIWVTYICFSVFFIPLVILSVCYIRIFMKVAQKANENRNKKTLRFRSPSGKVQLQSTKSTSLPKAKIKTLKLTFVIIVTFVVCSLPLFVLEMIMSFGNHCLISDKVYGFFAGMAACNSATNPFIFLGFNVSMSWIKGVRSRMIAAKRKPRFIYSATSSADSHPHLKHFDHDHEQSTQTYLQP